MCLRPLLISNNKSFDKTLECFFLSECVETTTHLVCFHDEKLVVFESEREKNERDLGLISSTF